MSATLAYRRDIDGLRAVAVGGVVAYHLAPEIVPGGFLGVDVFFVISGFLITSILWRDAQSDGHIAYWRVYARRARRILPALIVLVLGVLAAGALLAPPKPYADLALSAVAAVGFAANFHFKDQAGYFDPPAEAQPLLHTWSLAVEEQFYILWPLLIGLAVLPALLRGKPVRVAALLAGLSLVSLILAEVMARSAPVAAFYLLPSRLWELGIGGAIAVAAPVIALRLSSASREALGGAGIGLLTFALFGQSDSMVFPGLSALPACLGALCVIVSGLPGSAGPGRPNVTGLLRSAPFVGLGLISYSLYLWHWPLIAFTTLLDGPPHGVQLRLGLLAGALVLGWVSWRYVEQPLRRPLASDQRSVGLGVAAIALTAGLSLGIHLTGGWPSRAPDSLKAFEAEAIAPSPALDCQTPRIEHPDLPDACAFGPPRTGSSYDVLLLADSHGYNLTPALVAHAARHGLSGLRVVRPLCLPLEGYRFRRKGIDGVCSGFRTEVEAAIKANPDAKLIVLAGRWANHTFESALDGRGPETPAGRDVVLLDDETVELGRQDARRVMRGALNATVSRLLSETMARVVLVGQTPDFERDPSACGPIALWRGVTPEEVCSVSRALWGARRAFSQDFLNQIADGLERVSAVDPTDVFCSQESCAPASEGRPLYYDKTHLSALGAARLADELTLPTP